MPELFELYESYNLTHKLLLICFLMFWYDIKPADPSPEGEITFMPFHPNAFETLGSNLKSFRLHKKFVSAQSCSQE